MEKKVSLSHTVLGIGTIISLQYSFQPSNLQIKELLEAVKSHKAIVESLEDDHSTAMEEVAGVNRRRIEELEREKISLKEEIDSMAGLFRVCSCLTLQDQRK